MWECDLLAIAPLVPIQEARSRDGLSRMMARLRQSAAWRQDGRPIDEVFGEIDPSFIHHAEHYTRMLRGGTRQDGSRYGGAGGLRSVRMVIGEQTAEIVIAGSAEWRPEPHSYITRIRFANYPLIAAQPATWTERARLLLQDDVRVHCSCPAFRYYHAHAATEKGFALIPEDVAAPVNNPRDRGGVCKHLEHALRYVAAHYTTIAGAMKRHRQTEESTVSTPSPLIRLEAEIARLTESRILRTNLVPMVRYNADRKGYAPGVHGAPDEAYHFFTGVDGEMEAHHESDLSSARGLKPVMEKVYGTDHRWTDRTMRISADAKQGPVWRQTLHKKGETRLDTGYVKGTKYKVLGEVTSDLHPKMAHVFDKHVRENPDLAARLAKDTEAVGRPAYGPDWWHHPTVQHFLSTYDPVKHSNGDGIVHLKDRFPSKGLASELYDRYKLAEDHSEAVRIANHAHASVHRALHQLLKNPAEVGKKSTTVDAVSDAVRDAGGEHWPNAGRRDPNWDREDYQTWEATRRFLRTPQGAHMVMMNAIPHKDGVSAALVQGLHYASVMEEHEDPVTGKRVMKPKRDAEGKRVLEPRPKSYWHELVFGPAYEKKFTKQKATISTDADGGEKLTVSDVPIEPKDYEYEKGRETLPALSDFEQKRRDWLDKVAAHKHQQKMAKMQARAAARQKAAFASGAEVHASDLFKMDLAPARAAEAPAAAAPKKAGFDFSAFGSVAADTTRTFSGRQYTPTVAPAKPKPKPAFDFGVFDAPKKAPSPAELKIRAMSEPTKADRVLRDVEIDALHSELKKTDPGATRADAEDEWVRRKMSKKGIKALESVPRALRLSILSESVSQDITAAIAAAMERAAKMGMARTHAQLRMALSQCKSEGGSMPGTTVPADPRGMPHAGVQA